MTEANKSDEYDDLMVFYTSSFDSFQDMNETFQVKTGTVVDQSKNCALDLKFIQLTYELLMELPHEVQKSVLKSVINCLLSDQRCTILF